MAGGQGMTVRLILMAVCCVLWPLLAGAQVSCADWNRAEFFQTATPEEVKRLYSRRREP